MANVSGVTRHFTTAQEGFTTTLSGSVSAGAATVPYNSLAGYTDGDEIALVIEPGTANEQTVIGTKSGTSMVNCVWTEGTNQPHAAGSTAVDYVSATQQSAQTKGTLVGHNQDGSHKTFAESSIVPTAAIQNDAVTTVKIADGSITNAKLSTTAGELGGVWNTWAPTWTNLTVGNGTLTYAKFQNVGKTTRGRLHFVVGSTTSITGAITFTLPATLNADTVAFTNRGINSTVEMRDVSSSTSIMGVLTINNSTTAVVQYYVTSGTAISLANTSAANPFTFATGDIISMSFEYERA